MAIHATHKLYLAHFPVLQHTIIPHLCRFCEPYRQRVACLQASRITSTVFEGQDFPQVAKPLQSHCISNMKAVPQCCSQTSLMVQHLPGVVRYVADSCAAIKSNGGTPSQQCMRCDSSCWCSSFPQAKLIYCKHLVSCIVTLQLVLACA